MNDYQVMPPLSSDEYAELKADIAARGVMVPVEFDERGNVLDGHHRLKICAELGITDFPKVIRAGMTEEEKRTHARKLNMARRHLNAEQRRELIREQLRETPEKSDRQIAAGLCVSHPTVSSQREQMVMTGQLVNFTTSTGTDGKQYPRKPVSVFNPTRREMKAMQSAGTVERMAATGESAIYAARQLNVEAKAARKAFTLDAEMPEDMCRLYNADIRLGLPMIPDESVDCIITDPPYPAEYIPLYGALSSVAARVLKPGGSLIVMCGQSYLPEVISKITSAMKYHWTCAYLTPGGQSPQLFHKCVNTFWKPLIWLTKGDYIGNWVGDVLKSPPNDNDKQYHVWGQSFYGTRDIVERFTNPDDLILDPFLGGGTTGAAAVTLRRRFIGSDVVQENIDTAQERILEEYRNARSKT